jgi:hypothetical protein
MYLFFFISLLAQILSASRHLGTTHSVFFCSQMFLDLRFCIEKM